MPRKIPSENTGHIRIVEEYARLRSGEHCGGIRAHEGGAIRQRIGFAFEFSFLRIEGLRDQSLVLQVEKVARRHVDGPVAGMKQKTALLRIHGTDVDAGPSFVPTAQEKKVVFAIREKLRPAVTSLGTVLIELGLHDRCAPIRGYAIEYIADARREKNDAVTVPTASTGSNAHVTEGLQSPTVNIDPLQLPSGKEPDGVAIGGPKRMTRSLGADQRMHAFRVDRPQPPHHVILLVTHRDHYLPAVGRDRRSAPLNVAGKKLRVFRRQDRGPHDRHCGSGLRKTTGEQPRQ